QERIEPVVDAPLQLGDERQGRIFLGAAAGVAGRDEQERDDDADDRHHHQELDQGEPQAKARTLGTGLEPCPHRSCSLLTHDLQSHLRVQYRSLADRATHHPAWPRLWWVAPTLQECRNRHSSLPLWKLVMLSRSRIRV